MSRSSGSAAGRLQRARVSVSIIFLVHGILVSSWLARIPAVQETLQLPFGILGAVLLSAAAGAMFAMPVTSRLVNRFGSARLTQFATFLLCAAVALPPLATGAASLAAMLFLYGAAAGSMDVAMNTQAVAVETALGRPVMVGFHALFSAGGMIGALLGSGAARLGIAPAPNLIAVGAAMAVLAGAFALGLISDLPAPASAGRPRRSASDLLFRLAGLGFIAFCILLGEGAMADWSAVYLSHLAGQAVAPLGYAVFSLAMAMGRLIGDWFHERLGAVTTVRWGSGLAAAGLTAGLYIGTSAATLIGFACVGFGYSAIFPIICSVAGAKAGDRPQAGIAAVSMTGYLGFLVGPPLIGFAADGYTLRLALGLVAAMSALTCSLAGIVRVHHRETGEPEPSSIRM